jgi:hypothetical protein
MTPLVKMLDRVRAISVARRNLIGSDIWIVLVSVINFVEGTALVTGQTQTYWVFPFRAYLFLAHGHAMIAGLGLYVGVATALVGQFWPKMPLMARWALLLLQFLLLFFVMFWVWGSIYAGHDAFDAKQTSRLGVMINQIWRLFAPWGYFVCILARIRDEA